MNGNLPHWLERLFGVEAGPGEGTLWRLEYTWPWPPWLTLLGAAAAVGLIAFLYFREGAEAGRRYRLLLAGLRLGAIGVLLVMISQLAVSLQRSGLPYVVLLVDDSASMSVVDPYEPEFQSALARRLQAVSLGEPSRWNLAQMLLRENEGRILREMDRRYKLRVYTLAGLQGDESAGAPEILEGLGKAQPEGVSSPLGTAVRNVLGELRGTPPAAIVLLSDGINTEGPPLADAAAYARRKGVPLFTVGLGDQRPPKDLRVADLLVDDVVFVGDVVNFEFQLSATGLAGQKVEAVLRQSGKPGVLAKVEAVAGEDEAAQGLRLAYTPTEVGRFEYVVEVEPLPGEVQTANNRQQRTVEVRKEQIRALLVQGYPNYEFRYLRNLLARDETIRVDTVLQEADPEHAEQGETALRVVPVRREELFAYDVILLGDVEPGALSESVRQNLFEFVSQQAKGGGMVFIAGPRHMPQAFRDTPLAALMPVELATVRGPQPDQVLTEGFPVQPTELGLASPPLQLGDTPAESVAIWQNLPPLYWMLDAPQLRPGVRVLAVNPKRLGPDGEPLPLICLQYVGAGKVLMHLTDETWRWRWRVGDVYFARYWVQMIRYLGRSKLAAESGAVVTADRREYRRGEPVRLRVRFTDDRKAPTDDDGVTLVVEQEGRPSQRVALHRAGDNRGVFEGTLAAPPVGKYHAWVAIPAMEGQAPAADFAVLAPAGEFERTRMDAPALRRAAEETQGGFYTLANASRLLADLPEGHQVPIEALPPKPLWNRWPVLVCFLGLIIVEWLLRKRVGMM